MLDITELEEVTGYKLKKGTTRYYLDPDGTCVGKTCSSCWGVFPSDFFNKHSRLKYGLNTVCKECHRRNTREVNNRPAPDGMDITYNAWALKQRSAKNILRTEEEIEEDRKRIRSSGVKQCRICRETKSLTSYYKQRRNTDGLTSECIECCLERAEEVHLTVWRSKGIPLKCYICGGPYEHIEHVVPTSLGGAKGPENTLPACSACNLTKNRKPLIEYIRSREDIRVREGDILQTVRNAGITLDIET